VTGIEISYGNECRIAVEVVYNITKGTEYCMSL
jgi:hypothetical protein